jgi:hypothetical protein
MTFPFGGFNFFKTLHQVLATAMTGIVGNLENGEQQLCCSP